MTNYEMISAESLARIAYDAYYRDDLNTADAIFAYIDDIAPDAELRDALDADIADLLHNANYDDLFPDMTPADFDDIERFLSHPQNFDAFIDALALIIAA
jgi:hypothetical protein